MESLSKLMEKSELSLEKDAEPGLYIQMSSTHQVFSDLLLCDRISMEEYKEKKGNEIEDLRILLLPLGVTSLRTY